MKAAENFTKRLQKEDYFQDCQQRRKATQLLVESRLNYRQQMQAIKAIMQSAWSDREKVAAIEFLLEVNTDLHLPPGQEEQVQILTTELVRTGQNVTYHLWGNRSAWLRIVSGTCSGICAPIPTRFYWPLCSTIPKEMASLPHQPKI